MNNSTPTLHDLSCVPTALVLLACWWPVAPTMNVSAQERRVVITEERDADADYQYQGEYYGPVAQGVVSSGTAQIMGLQIVAQGEGNYLAVEYPGGLPGNGWNRQVRYTMEVTRDGDQLRVLSDGYQWLINGDRAEVRSYDDRPLGTLEKVIRESPTLGIMPPPSATVLFDGTHTEHFKNGTMDATGWLRRGTELVKAYGDFILHVEFRTPYMPLSRGQARGNSGIYIQSRYEVQILDSFGLGGVFNECGALYRSIPPELNMCLPPLQWQTYDIEFHSPKFNDKQEKTEHARLTLRHNGVFVHYNREIPNKTGAGQAEGPMPLPTKFQDHSDPVVFRNVWIVDLSPDNPRTQVSQR